MSTTPVVEAIEASNPCDELKKIGENQDISNALYNTKSNAFNSNIERGYSVKKNISLEIYATPYLQNASNATSIKVPLRPNQYGNIHSHTKVGHYIPSGWDINTLYQISQKYDTAIDITATQDLYVNIMTTPYCDYAIKIEDITKLATIAQYFTTDEKALKFNEKFLDQLSKLGGMTGNITTAQYEKFFLDFCSSTYDFHVGIDNFDFGISLYRRNNSKKTIVPEGNKWIKLELDDDGNIIEKPC